MGAVLGRSLLHLSFSRMSLTSHTCCILLPIVHYRREFNSYAATPGDSMHRFLYFPHVHVDSCSPRLTSSSVHVPHFFNFYAYLYTLCEAHHLLFLTSIIARASSTDHFTPFSSSRYLGYTDKCQTCVSQFFFLYCDHIPKSLLQTLFRQERWTGTEPEQK